MAEETDRELLELAAMAAGYKSWDWRVGGCVLNVYDSEHKHDTFAPLISDGDALRLAVGLNLTLRCYMGNACAQTTVPGGPSVCIDEWNQADPCAATRRAIVRAAAEIGRRMP